MISRVIWIYAVLQFQLCKFSVQSVNFIGVGESAGGFLGGLGWG